MRTIVPLNPETDVSFQCVHLPLCALPLYIRTCVCALTCLCVSVHACACPPVLAYIMRAYEREWHRIAEDFSVNGLGKCANGWLVRNTACVNLLLVFSVLCLIRDPRYHRASFTSLGSGVMCEVLKMARDRLKYLRIPVWHTKSRISQASTLLGIFRKHTNQPNNQKLTDYAPSSVLFFDRSDSSEHNV